MDEQKIRDYERGIGELDDTEVQALTVQALTDALEFDGPALVEVLTDPNALSIPPEIKKDQVFGFATAMSRIVLNRGAGEAVSMARSNLRNIPRG